MAGADRSDLSVRAAVGAALAVAAVLALWAAGWLLWAFVGAAALIALAEWGLLVHAGRVRRMVAVVALAVGLMLASPAMWGPERDAVAMVVSLAVVLVLTFGNAKLAGGLAYLGIAALALLFLRTRPDGLALAGWTVLVVALTDTGAYFAGRAIGGPKLAPKLSPAKTWAGLGGGVVAAVAGGAALALATGLPAPLLWLGAPLAVVAQLGDLFESGLKRAAGVRNSGAILPGHGGMLDRVDGATPVLILMGALAAGGAF